MAKSVIAYCQCGQAGRVTPFNDGSVPSYLCDGCLREKTGREPLVEQDVEMRGLGRVVQWLTRPRK
jgi:hypothetical protein